MNKVIIFAIIFSLFGAIGCRSSSTNPAGPDIVTSVRQKLEELPEPTFESLEVYTHDLAAKGTALLVEKYPDTEIPLRVVSEGALSVLEKEMVTMFDVITLSQSLDIIKEGKVKAYLDLAWTLLELNGVVRRTDLTTTLTAREQRLLVALFHGIKLGTEPAENRDSILNGYGPRYGDEKDVPPAGK